jgi:hypothetical protein
MNFKDIKKGEILSTTMYLHVVSKGKDSIEVKDSYGREFTVRGVDLIEKSMKSSDQVVNTVKVTRTELAEKFTVLGDLVFTVNFDKQDGENRTLRGYKVSTENLMGRVNVIDLDVTTGYAQRQVDLRTIKYLIVSDVKYVVK